MSVEVPGDVALGDESDAVGVCGEEGAVLDGAEGQGVDAHCSCPGPLFAAGVVSNPLEFEDAGGEVVEGVAADNQGVVSCAVADGLVD